MFYFHVMCMICKSPEVTLCGRRSINKQTNLLIVAGEKSVPASGAQGDLAAGLLPPRPGPLPPPFLQHLASWVACRGGLAGQGRTRR